MRATRAAVVLIVSVSAAIAVQRLEAQQPRQLFVNVLDSRGVPVSDLRPEDVKVFENGTLCRTVTLEPVNWPMKLTVLVDNGPRAQDYLATLRTGLRYFYNEIPDEIELSLLTLAPQPRWIQRPTTDLDKAIKSIDLITPDSGNAKLFDGIAEAASRIEKEKGNYFPVIVVVASDVGSSDAPLEYAYLRLLKQVREHAITVHFVLLTTGAVSANTVTGSVQTHVGLALTELSGGRYDNVNASSRLATLLPEIGQQIAKSHFKQTHQYRITYDPPPGNSKAANDVSLSVTGLNGVLSIAASRDGHLP